MSGFWQAIAGVLIAVVLLSALDRFGKDVNILLSVAVCVMVLVAAVAYLGPVLELIDRLTKISRVETEWISILLKTVGIGLVSQFAGLICADCGNSAIGKAVEVLAAAAVLWLSVPLITALLDLVEGLAGGL